MIGNANKKPLCQFRKAPVLLWVLPLTGVRKRVPTATHASQITEDQETPLIPQRNQEPGPGDS